MFNIQETARDLESMLKDMALNSGMFVPLNKDTIKCKNYLVTRDTPDGWNVVLLDKRKKHIANTFLKVSALAIVKLHQKRQLHRIDDVLRNDQIFEKNYVDSLYYKNTYKKSSDEQVKDTAQWRYEIAHAKAKHCKQAIDAMFYSSIT